MKKLVLFTILFASVLYSDNNIIIDTDVANMLIKGNGEQCKVSMNSNGVLLRTDCLQITNSKGVKILCTKKKKMCKTVSEMSNALSYISSPKSNATSLNALRQGMKYSEAREIILNASWQGLNKRWQDVPKSGQVHNMYYTNGWEEVEDCSGTGMGFCRFEFRDINNKILVVITQGGCLTSKGELPKKGEKCDVVLSSWSFE